MADSESNSYPGRWLMAQHAHLTNAIRERQSEIVQLEQRRQDLDRKLTAATGGACHDDSRKFEPITSTKTERKDQ